jgi:hypothetical protein
MKDVKDEENFDRRRGQRRREPREGDRRRTPGVAALLRAIFNRESKGDPTPPD